MVAILTLKRSIQKEVSQKKYPKRKGVFSFQAKGYQQLLKGNAFLFYYRII